MAEGFYPTLWSSTKITLRVVWRAIRQLFHETTGAIFALFALYGGISAWRQWHTRPAAWLLGFTIVYAFTMVCSARAAFADIAKCQTTQKNPPPSQNAAPPPLPACRSKLS
jgi:hypothetical protein